MVRVVFLQSDGHRLNSSCLVLHVSVPLASHNIHLTSKACFEIILDGKHELFLNWLYSEQLYMEVDNPFARLDSLSDTELVAWMLFREQFLDYSHLKDLSCFK